MKYRAKDTVITRILFGFGDFSCPGALELWEMAENEHLLVNRFTRYEHDDVVTAVSPVVGGTDVVTGSTDCRLDPHTLYKNMIPKQKSPTETHC